MSRFLVPVGIATVLLLLQGNQGSEL